MTASITMPCGRVALIDAEDLPLVHGIKWYSCKRRNVWYARGTLPGDRNPSIRLHTLLMGGPADHISGDGLDNRRANLRPCDNKQNARNAGKHKGTLPKGVTRSGKRFVARIVVDREPIYLGSWTTLEQAALAYDRAALAHFGEWARPNEKIFDLGILTSGAK